MQLTGIYVLLSIQRSTYCKFGNFRKNLIFANSIKRHICDVKTSRLGHDIPISVNDRVILTFREGFNFTKLRMCFAKIKSSRKFQNLQYKPKPKIIEIFEITIIVIFVHSIISMLCIVFSKYFKPVKYFKPLWMKGMK